MSDDGRSMEWVEVTPETAARWLATVDRQRKMSALVAKQYAQDMREGRWREDVTAIAFDKQGRLVQGQHRLTAVVQSGCTIGFWVRRGVSEDAIPTMDNGKPRSVADQLAFQGIRDGHQLRAAARMVMSYQVAPDKVWVGHAAVLSNPLILGEIRDNLETYRAAGSVAYRAYSGARVKRTPFQAWHVLVQWMSSHEDAVEPFVDGVAEGAGLALGDPRLALRNYYIRNPRMWGQGQSHLLANIRAWNAWVTGRSLRLLKAPRRDELPMPKVL